MILFSQSLRVVLKSMHPEVWAVLSNKSQNEYLFKCEIMFKIDTLFTKIQGITPQEGLCAAVRMEGWKDRRMHRLVDRE